MGSSSELDTSDIINCESKDEVELGPVSQSGDASVGLTSNVK